MKTKIIIASIAFIVFICTFISVFIFRNQFTLMKIQLPIIIMSTYIFAVFLASYSFDKRIEKAYKNGLENINPYKLLIQINPYINWFLFVFFGIGSIASCLVLIFLT